MVRIAGANIPDDKRAEISLGYIYGIGNNNAKAILIKAKITNNPRIKDLTEEQLNQLRSIVEKEYTVEGDLKQITNQNIRRLREINAYRGIRHKRNLPVHGQRTRTNARTKRGKKVTMGSGRKKAAAKT